MNEQQILFPLDCLVFSCEILALEGHRCSIFIVYMPIFSVYDVLGEDSLYTMSISLFSEEKEGIPHKPYVDSGII